MGAEMDFLTSTLDNNTLYIGRHILQYFNLDSFKPQMYPEVANLVVFYGNLLISGISCNKLVIPSPTISIYFKVVQCYDI